MATRNKPKNGMARVIEESGLSYSDVEKLAFVRAPRIRCGRETIRRYAIGLIPEESWNEDVVLAVALAIDREPAEISVLAGQRLREHFDLLTDGMGILPSYLPLALVEPTTGQLELDLPFEEALDRFVWGHDLALAR